MKGALLSYLDTRKYSQHKKLNSSYTFIVIPGEVGSSRRFSLSKRTVIFTAVLLFLSLGGGVGVVVDYLRLQRVAKEFENLRAENHSIRSEAAAIVSRLQEVQVALNQVDSFSTELKEITTKDPMVGAKDPKNKKDRYTPPKNLRQKLPLRTPPRGTYKPIVVPNLEIRPGGIKQTVSLGGIGPIPKEDFIAMNNNAQINNQFVKINLDQLEFKKTFTQLLELRKRSKTKAKDLQFLLKDIRAYNDKISTTPTLAPLDGGFISSLYGQRISPISGFSQHHSGIDFAAPIGTVVRAGAQGMVSAVRTAEDYGNVIEIDHGNGIKTRYAHLSKFYVKAGDTVIKGAPIGEVGNTGRSTGPHLHYEVELSGGRKVDPVKYIHIW